MASDRGSGRPARGRRGGAQRGRSERPRPRHDEERAADPQRAPVDWLADDHGPEPSPRTRRRDTLARVLWAIPWIAFAIAIVAVGDLLFAAAMALFAIAGMRELFLMTRRSRPLAPVAFVVAVAMVVAAQYGSHLQILLAALTAFPLMFAAAAVRGERRHITYSMAVTVFGIAWIALPFAHAVLLRDLPLHGGALVIDVLVATFVADTAAYGGGRLFGRRPLAPQLSPNKTVEGLLFGIVGGTLGFWFAGLYQDWLSGLDALAMGIVVALLAPVGDLFESMVKRDLGVKDSGNLFGPHGGVLDRLDAVMFTVVAGYYMSLALVY